MNKKELSDLNKQRADQVQSVIDLVKLIAKDQQTAVKDKITKDLLNKLEFDEKGNIKNTVKNRNVLNQVDKYYKEAIQEQGAKIASNLVKSFVSIVNKNAEYFSFIAEETKVKPIQKKVLNNLRGWLGFDEKNKVEQNGYLNTLIQAEEVKQQIKNITLKSVISQTGFNDLKNTLENYIEGKDEKIGAFEKYYRNYTYDTISQVDRQTSNIFADDLNLNFAVYDGGLIETSRPFCVKHAGKVYHKTEIAEFKPKTAIPDNYNPFTDLGGYACRHHLNWISDALALLLRPDAEQFLKEKPKTPKTEEKPKTEDPKKDKKKSEKPKAAGETEKNLFENVNTINEFKKKVENITGIKKISVAREANLDFIKQGAEQFNNLLNEYNIETKTPLLSFNSKGGYYGRVTYYQSGEIVDVNLGHKTDQGKGRRADTENPENNLKLSKSAVDEENIIIATATHEFLHYITSSRRKSKFNDSKVREFWQKIQDLKNEYHKEVNNFIRSEEREKAGELYLGKYASTNIDEFAAESFTQYKLKKKPTKYALKVGKLIDEYFKN